MSFNCLHSSDRNIFSYTTLVILRSRTIMFCSFSFSLIAGSLPESSRIRRSYAADLYSVNWSKYSFCSKLFWSSSISSKYASPKSSCLVVLFSMIYSYTNILAYRESLSSETVLTLDYQTPISSYM